MHTLQRFTTKVHTVKRCITQNNSNPNHNPKYILYNGVLLYYILYNVVLQKHIGTTEYYKSTNCIKLYYRSTCGTTVYYKVQTVERCITQNNRNRNPKINYILYNDILLNYILYNGVLQKYIRYNGVL